MNVFLKKIDEIIPHELFLLMNAPIIIGCFIDFALIDFRYMLINIIWMMVFSIPSVLLKLSFPNKIGAIIFFIIGTIETVHWILIKGPITVVSILTVGATNLEESIGFLSIKSSFLLLLVLPYIFLFIYSLRKKREYEQYKGKYISIILVALASTCFISENAINERFVRKGVPQIFKVFFSFSGQYDFYKQTETNLKAKQIGAYTENKDDQTFVLIIGESLSRHHMSLYDYNRKTTPYLDERDDIFVFNDVVSPYSSTANSVLSILSESNLNNNKKLNQSIDLFDVFASAGFKTYWISNQPPYGIWENTITSFAKKADNYRSVNLTSNSSMEAVLTASYDSKIFNPFAKILESSVSKKLIIVHLMGCHATYRKRYPNSFNNFEGKTNKEETIAEYDNSVLYNDYIVDSLLNTISTYSVLNNKIMSVIYLSDHGENVYDEGNELGHSFAGKLPKVNVDIPFIVWLSDKFKIKYPNKSLEIQNQIDKPFVTDDLFHSIIDINSIETLSLDESRSLFNKNFNDKRKRILCDGKNYDD